VPVQRKAALTSHMRRSWAEKLNYCNTGGTHEEYMGSPTRLPTEEMP